MNFIACYGYLHNQSIQHLRNLCFFGAEIVVLDQGNVAETGTHAELLAKGGLYHSMWEQQQHAARGTASDNEE